MAHITSVTQNWLVPAQYSAIAKRRQHREVSNTETTHQL